MAYHPDVRELALTYYMALGSYEAVVRRLRSERVDCSTIDRKTIQRFAKEDNWTERIANIQSEKRDQADKKRAEYYEYFTGRLRELLDQCLDYLIADLEPSSFASTVFAMNATMKTYIKLTGMGESGGELRPAQLRGVMEKLRRAMISVPALEQALTPEVLEQLASAAEAEFASS
ncbi:MAG: hypothetical protein P9M15_01690 [Candidatus Electryoneaceae bacterium]|nr:hypothetical protein [Candidatus Electryoneaceae bacterium]